MLWSDRRIFLGGILAALSSCGFRPLYGESNAGADALVGNIELQEATDPESFAYRERLRRRVGDAGTGATYHLQWLLRYEETGVAITRTSDVTRLQVTATAQYRLISLADGKPLQEGDVKTVGAYDATAEAYATRAAQRDERQQLAEELAELTVTRILAAASG
jgi:hypothetical protein